MLSINTVQYSLYNTRLQNNSIISENLSRNLLRRFLGFLREKGRKITDMRNESCQETVDSMVLYIVLT